MASLFPAFPNMLVSPLTFVARWVRWPKGITLNPSRVARGSTQAAMRRTAAEQLSPPARERVRTVTSHLNLDGIEEFRDWPEQCQPLFASDTASRRSNKVTVHESSPLV